MKSLVSSIALVMTAFVIPVSFAQSPLAAESTKALAVGNAADTVDVQHVIDAYHEAVLAHDGSRLSSLFIPQGSQWINVLSDEAYARAKAKAPSAQKIRVGSYTDFTKQVRSCPASITWCTLQ